MYVTDRVNENIYAVTTGGWLAIHERASLTPLFVATPPAGWNNTQVSTYDNKAGSTLSTAEPTCMSLYLLQCQRLMTSYQWMAEYGGNI